MDYNLLLVLPGTGEASDKEVLLPKLETLSVKNNSLSTMTISTVEKRLPKSLKELVIDENARVDDVPGWVYDSDRKNFKFSALPICKRGEILSLVGSQCNPCELGSCAITGRGKKCEKCGEDRICRGAYDVLPNSGWWRGLPYFHTPIGPGHESYNGSVHFVTAFTGDPEWDETVHIYPCPNPDACVTSVDGAIAPAYSYCKDGYTGPACALCDASHVWLEGHQCVDCKGSTGSHGWFVAASVLAALVGCVLLYVTTARPLFRTVEESIVRCFVAASSALSPATVARAMNARNTHSGWLGQMRDAWKERFEAFYEIYTEHHATSGAMNRSMVGFLQVIGNIGKLIRWPAEFTVATSWFTFFKLSFDVPGVGCVIRRAFEYTFYDRLLLYCLAPVAIIAVLNLPLAWAWLRQVPTALRDEVCKRCINWTLRVLFFVYPMVSQLVISALVCKQLGPDLWLLSYDYRVNCLEAHYKEVKTFAWAMLALWTIGYPLSMLIVMKVYRVPDMAGRKKRKAELHALCWHTLKLSPGGPRPRRRPNRRRQSATTSEPLETTDDVPKSSAADQSDPLKADAPNPPPADSMAAVTTDWLAGEAGTLRELSVDTLTWLCQTHQLEVGAVGVPGVDAMAAALERHIAELIDFEELAVPRLKWDPQSADEGERLACAHIGSLFESYAPKWWWYASCGSARVLPPFRFAASDGSVRLMQTCLVAGTGLRSSKFSASSS